MGLIPSASYSITVRLEVPADGLPASQLTAAVESAGGMVTVFDVNAARGDFMQVDLTCAAPDANHADKITEALAAVEGVTVGKVSDRTFLLHLGGKIEVRSKVPLRTRDDLSMAYTPRVPGHRRTARRLATATALADVVTDEERHANYIVPSVFHPDLATTVAAAVSSAIPRPANG